MHLTRPKSSKGRSRPAVNPGDADTVRRPPASPDSPVSSRPDRALRSQSQPTMRPPSTLTRNEVLQHAPPAPPWSLNQYRVLPSIERRRSEASSGARLGKPTATFGLCGGDDDDDDPQPPDPGPSRAAGGLLLAVRAPCGGRFQQHFEPSDTLRAVRASAEARYGAKYGDASIETAEVPRRTFADMDLTLDQCGILNRSLLCISLKEDS